MATANHDKAQQEFRRAVEILKPFCKKNIGYAAYQLVSTLAILYASFFFAFWVFQFGWYYTIVFIPVTAAMLCRCYVIIHDCGHRSFFRSDLANDIAGNLAAFPILIPHFTWKYIHDVHHKHVGNLDMRDVNPESWTMTVREYNNSGAFKKALYRFMRSRFWRFAIAPWAVFGVLMRFPNPKFDWKGNVSVMLYDVLYVAIAVLLLKYFAPVQILLAVVIPLILFFTIAFYVFYAQHQFEDTYWEYTEDWNYAAASFHGSTYLSAPKWFHRLSGNVMHHNIHHVISSIPNYNLAKAHSTLRREIEYPEISIFKVYSMLDFKLWDEEKKKMVGFPV
jgi:acyl-lipid omega-6 desaturase (Delta-12 desaturase)